MSERGERNERMAQHSTRRFNIVLPNVERGPCARKTNADDPAWDRRNGKKEVAFDAVLSHIFLWLQSEKLQWEKVKHLRA